MWLAISLSIVGLGLVLLVLTGFSARRRWQRMRRAGGRLVTRAGSLSAMATELADRLQLDEHFSPQD